MAWHTIDRCPDPRPHYGHQRGSASESKVSRRELRGNVIEEAGQDQRPPVVAVRIRSPPPRSSTSRLEGAGSGERAASCSC
jgi:hypothetical protein